MAWRACAWAMAAAALSPRAMASSPWRRYCTSRLPARSSSSSVSRVSSTASTSPCRPRRRRGGWPRRYSPRTAPRPRAAPRPARWRTRRRDRARGPARRTAPAPPPPAPAACGRCSARRTSGRFAQQRVAALAPQGPFLAQPLVQHPARQQRHALAQLDVLAVETAPVRPLEQQAPRASASGAKGTVSTWRLPNSRASLWARSWMVRPPSWGRQSVVFWSTASSMASATACTRFMFCTRRLLCDSAAP